MDLSKEEAISLKKAAAAEMAQLRVGSGLQGNLCAARAGLRDRVESQAGEAERQSRKADRLRELGYLLDKNPEIARILDLLDEVRA